MVRADPGGGFRFSYGSERRPLATHRANRSCPTGWHDGSFRGGSAPASLKPVVTATSRRPRGSFRGGSAPASLKPVVFDHSLTNLPRCFRGGSAPASLKQPHTLT